MAADKREIFQRRGLTLEVADKKSPPVMIDRVQFMRLTENLFENAIKYKRGEKVHMLIDFVTDGKFLRVKFSDDGRGVASSELPKIFDIFYRTDPARSSKGSGLGLAVVKQIVEALNGNVFAEETPGVDGFQLCREIRNVKDTPILIVTARREDIDKIRASGLGADDCVTKTFSPNELVARAKAHISRYERLTGKSPKKFLQFGDLEIRPEAHRVFVGGREVSLKNREFELLLFLAENSNIVFNKDRLFDRIWGLDAIGDTATVAVHIKRIREKIEPDTANPRYIKTVWGAGYRFKG